MPKKKTSKKNTAAAKAATGATKAATAASNLMLTAGNVAGAALTTPFTEVGQFNGRIHYSGVAAFLISTIGPPRLLLLFKPSGNYTSADVGATASHLRFGVGKQEGDPITISGHAGNAFGSPCIFIIAVS